MRKRVESYCETVAEKMIYIDNVRPIIMTNSLRYDAQYIFQHLFIHIQFHLLRSS